VRRFREQRNGVGPEAANGLDSRKRREYPESYAKTPCTSFTAVVMVVVRAPVLRVMSMIMPVLTTTPMAIIVAMPRVMVVMPMFRVVVVAVGAHRQFLLSL